MICFYIWAAFQIILESFPISSSGHSLLLETWCPLQGSLLFYGPLRTYLGYLLHIPTAIIICLFFYQQWSFPFKHIYRCWPLVLKISTYTALADTVTVLCYVIKEQYSCKIPLSVGFALTACSLLSLHWCRLKKPVSWDIPKAVILGFVQSIAFIPGVSRFALTFTVARWMGILPRRAFQITFLIQWPLIVLGGFYSLNILGPLITELLHLPGILGMLGASISAYVGLYGVERMVSARLMWLWSLYMLIPLIISIIREW